MSLNTTPTHPDADSYVTVAETDAFLQNRVDVSDWTALSNDQKEATLKSATRQINSLRFFSEPLFEIAKHYRLKQPLYFPRCAEDHLTGTAQSGSTTTLVDTNLANQPSRYTDFWVGGAVIIVEGTNKGATRKISAFNGATGQVTVDAFASAIDSTSQYLIVQRVPIEVKNATMEQAFYLVKGGGDRARMQAEGVKSYQIGDVSETFVDGTGKAGRASISNEAMGYLKGFVSRIGRIV